MSDQPNSLRERYLGIASNQADLDGALQPNLPVNDLFPNVRMTKGNKGVLPVNGTFNNGTYDAAGIPDDILDRGRDASGTSVDDLNTVSV